MAILAVSGGDCSKVEAKFRRPPIKGQTMPLYRLSISDSQTLEVGNADGQTEVKNEIVSPGSHQSSNMSFTTGDFVSPPRYVREGEGVVLVFTTADGERQMRIAGGEMETGEFSLDRSRLEVMPVA